VAFSHNSAIQGQGLAAVAGEQKSEARISEEEPLAVVSRKERVHNRWR